MLFLTLYECMNVFIYFWTKATQEQNKVTNIGNRERKILTFNEWWRVLQKEYSNMEKRKIRQSAITFWPQRIIYQLVESSITTAVMNGANKSMLLSTYWQRLQHVSSFCLNCVLFNITVFFLEISSQFV